MSLTEDKTPLYSIGTWDVLIEAYTPQAGLSVPAFNIDRSQLRQAIRELRAIGYTAHRIRERDGSHDDNDTSVLIERTDGKSSEQIMEEWRR